MDQGILYVATGDDFVDEAQISVKTLRDSMDNVPIAIVTDRSRNLADFDEVITLSNPSYGFRDKIQGMRQSPYEHTVFLDTDTYIHDGFTELFDLLDRFDIAATHNQNRDLYTGTSLGVPEAFPEYSSGVVAFNKSDTEKLFNTWLETYEESHPGDQPSFRKSLYECNIQLATIPREYNLSPRIPSHVSKNIKIFHGRLLDIKSPGADKNVELEDIMGKMNQSSGHRLFDKNGYQVVPNSSLLYRLDRSLETNGINETIKKGVQKIYNLLDS